jgi:hypothetical protein
MRSACLEVKVFASAEEVLDSDDPCKDGLSHKRPAPDGDEWPTQLKENH